LAHHTPKEGTVPTYIIEAPEGVTAEKLVIEATAGAVKFFRLRGNGTTRRVHFLPDGSEAREVAEWVDAQHEAGKPVRDIAKEMKTSPASVRRILSNLRLTEMVETADEEELADWLEFGEAEYETEEDDE
jgi:hypothetical protein